MSDFKLRLIDEKEQLDIKCGKLDAFLKSEASETIDALQRSLLDIQFHAMLTYSQCLLERISWLQKPEPTEVK